MSAEHLVNRQKHSNNFIFLIKKFQTLFRKTINEIENNFRKFQISFLQPKICFKGGKLHRIVSAFRNNNFIIKYYPP